MVGESNQNVFFIQINASSFAEFEICEFETSRFDFMFFSVVIFSAVSHRMIRIVQGQEQSYIIMSHFNIVSFPNSLLWKTEHPVLELQVQECVGEF